MHRAVLTSNPAGTPFGYPEPIPQRLNGAAATIRAQ
jgi:hypothetical protein